MKTEKLNQETARGLLIGADLDREEWKVLRRRVEDSLRKNPSALLETAARMMVEGWIRVDDLI